MGIVALPLAMAFAIASGLKPEAGIWTAIIAGFLISALGGSAVQIGGPAGAFIVIVYGIVERYGVANLLIATACAGVLLFLMGLFRLGNLIRYVPVSIVIGFTNGIAMLILISQLKDWLGLTVPKMPADMFSQLHTLASHLGTFNPYAFGLGLACLAGLFLWPTLLHDKTRFGYAVRLVLGRVTELRAVRAIVPVAGKPPKKRVTTLAMPCAITSWLGSWRGCPLAWSATRAHKSDSIAPSSAMVSVGVTSCLTVSHEKSGSAKPGTPSGMPPKRVPMVSTGRAKPQDTSVSVTSATIGPGMREPARTARSSVMRPSTRRTA